MKWRFERTSEDSSRTCMEWFLLISCSLWLSTLIKVCLKWVIKMGLKHQERIHQLGLKLHLKSKKRLINKWKTWTMREKYNLRWIISKEVGLLKWCEIWVKGILNDFWIWQKTMKTLNTLISKNTEDFCKNVMKKRNKGLSILLDIKKKDLKRIIIWHWTYGMWRRVNGGFDRNLS